MQTSGGPARDGGELQGLQPGGATTKNAEPQSSQSGAATQLQMEGSATSAAAYEGQPRQQTTSTVRAKHV